MNTIFYWLFGLAYVILGTGLLACVYALYRNSKVGEYRMKLLRRNIVDYHRLPSYQTMFRQWWVWPLDKFLERR